MMLGIPSLGLAGYAHIATQTIVLLRGLAKDPPECCVEAQVKVRSYTSNGMSSGLTLGNKVLV